MPWEENEEPIPDAILSRGCGRLDPVEMVLYGYGRVSLTYVPDNCI